MFQPSSVFLQLGSYEGTFIIGADQSLYPISYFYSAVKQEEVTTYYQITTNNNIRVKNTPVNIMIPSTINLPVGGCSNPFLVLLPNLPMNDVTISFTYNNLLYGQNDFFPNQKLTNSQLSFNQTVSNSTVSFCSSVNITQTNFPLTFVLSGTNYQSYTFIPSNVITINII